MTDTDNMSEHYIRAIFYLTPFKWKYLLSWKKIKKYMANWLISIRTMSKYSHCEIWVPDGDGTFMYPSPDPESDTWYTIGPFGTCYTSTMRGDVNGTVKRDASLVLDHPEHWHYVEIPLTDEQYKFLILAMDMDVANNKGYSRWDILKFVSPIHIEDNERNICSEACNNWLVYIAIIKGFGIVSPAKVLKKLLKCGYEVKSLKGIEE